MVIPDELDGRLAQPLEHLVLLRDLGAQLEDVEDVLEVHRVVEPLDGELEEVLHVVLVREEEDLHLHALEVVNPVGVDEIEEDLQEIEEHCNDIQERIAAKTLTFSVARKGRILIVPF